MEKTSDDSGTIEVVSAAPSRPNKRIEWVDDVKGLAILLVVYGHVQGGATLANALPHGFQAFSRAFVYTFHMPAFFFISGLLSTQALARNKVKYIRNRAETIAWPYLVWIVLNAVSLSIFARFYHSPASHPWHAVLICLWYPGGFWFLYTLFCVQLLMLATVWIRIEAIFVLSLIGFLFANPASSLAVDEVLFHLPFFVAGVLGWPLMGWTAKWIGAPGYICAVLLFVFQAAWLWNFPGFGALLLGFTGTFGLIALSLGMSGTFFSKIFSRLGAASLGVYLMHPYIQGMVRGLLEHFTRLGVGLSVTVETIAATIIPIFLYEIVMASQLRWLFSLKPQEKKPVL